VPAIRGSSAVFPIPSSAGIAATPGAERPDGSGVYRVFYAVSIAGSFSGDKAVSAAELLDALF
jgi:hypothetical protein